VADLANKRLPDTQPFVGAAAFSHKAGLHIDGVLKASHSFEHIRPEWVGNRREFLVSEVAGRSLMAQRLKPMGGDFSKDSPEVIALIHEVKEKESRGYQFENAQGSFELMAAKVLGRYQSFFTLKQFSILTERGRGEADATHATAMIKIAVDGKNEITAAEGNGPVDALNAALKKALGVFYPVIHRIHLTDYKVRVIDSEAGAAASVRVLIEFTDGRNIWSTVGVSTDVIEASWLALADGLEVALMRAGEE
jgi:2-isopropylmalate synthase